MRWQRSRASGSPSLRSLSVWARPKRCARSPETMDVTQAKLAMGYRAASEDTPALLLANLIFGGYPTPSCF